MSHSSFKTSRARPAQSPHVAHDVSSACCVLYVAGALPEQQLLVACGADPNGKLAVVRSGMGITPFTLDGPQLPVRCPAHHPAISANALVVCGVPVMCCTKYWLRPTINLVHAPIL